ncbi:MAG TPA: hypothetical protein VJJ79_02015 [Candidatus Nanoarchaeia archaeon]|nr:hypothetical protein [Candidatus Nanoarchaeia archaeon]
MLTRKGQVPEAVEIIGASIIIIIGVIVLLFANAEYQHSLENAKEKYLPAKSLVEVLDVQFMGTDILNTMRLQITEEKTLGELFTALPEESSSLKEQGLIMDQVSLAALYECRESLQTTLQNFLGKTYGNKWAVTLMDQENIIFMCMAPGAIPTRPLSETYMTVPSLDPEKDLTVLLEAYP